MFANGIKLLNSVKSILVLDIDKREEMKNKTCGLITYILAELSFCISLTASRYNPPVSIQMR